ncbi:hypothetical protein ACFVUS_29685 [Nocardia sp. NPDC058058]|uniref:hypothetical protein n=1 Tax=Nocardia sp. NPDC058058 TaxID=3346317 RepID=UPI0036DED82C
MADKPQSFRNVTQYCVFVDSDNLKLPVVLDILSRNQVNRGVLYTADSARAKVVSNGLAEQSYPVRSRSEDSSVDQAAISKFNTGEIRFLTAPHALVVEGAIPLVVNYDLPPDLDTYAACAANDSGRKRIMISLVLPSDKDRLDAMNLDISTLVLNSG